MLSRLLKDTVEARPLSLRQSATDAPDGITRLPRDRGMPPDEVAPLRAKLTETVARAEEQARQAYEAGMRAGEAAARQHLEAEVRQQLERLAATIADIADTRSEVIHRAEADTVHLAVEIARRILHRELSVDNTALEALIKAALEKLEGQDLYRVRVHPDQETLIKSCLMRAGRGQSVNVVADPMQPKGGALFEINQGSLDASVNTQLQEIERGLADQLETRS